MMAALARAAGMLVRPGRNWDLVRDEPLDRRALLRGYIAPLAAIPAVCGVAGALVFGFSIANVGVHMSLVGLILGALSGYVLTLVFVFLLAALVDVTAPLFGGTRNGDQALKLAAYAATPSWLFGVAEIYPNIGLPVGILAGTWSLYLLYLGLPKLMQVPERHRLTAFATLLGVVLLLTVVRGVAVSKASELGGPLSASYAPR